jgi:hypothetical protein
MRKCKRLIKSSSRISYIANEFLNPVLSLIVSMETEPFTHFNGMNIKKKGGNYGRQVIQTTCWTMIP